MVLSEYYAKMRCSRGGGGELKENLGRGVPKLLILLPCTDTRRFFITLIPLFPNRIKAESIRKLSNFNFQWKKKPCTKIISSILHSFYTTYSRALNVISHMK